MSDVFAVKQYSSILNDLIAWIIANQDKVTDFNEGSVIRSFVEAIALEMEQLYIRTRVGFNKGLINVPFEAFNFVQQAAQAAAGQVVFSRAGTTGTVTIPAGTIVATSSGIQFATSAAGSILNGNTSSAAIGVLAVVEGTTGNVPAHSILSIVTPVAGVETVDNAAGTTAGLDQESDAQFLTRFQQFINGLGRCNKAGILAAAKSVDGVRSASLVEHFPPVSNYNVTVYIDDGTGTPGAALIATVLAAVVGDGTEVSPGYRAGGINVEVVAPTIVTVSVTAAITSDGSLAPETIAFNVTQALTNYINGLLIGQSCIKNKIVSTIMDVVGVANVSVSVPSGDTTISGNQVARIGTVTITFV